MTTLSITLSLLLILALLILLLPLTKQFDANRKAVIGIALFIPLFSMAGYFILGTPEFAEISVEKDRPQQITLVDKLEAKLQKNPKDIQGWLLLGRSYMVTKEYPKAISAFEKAYVLDSHNLNAILPLADALAISNHGSLIGRPYQLLLHAYELDDENQMTLWLLGMAEKQLNNIDSAALYWDKLYQQLPSSSADRKKVRQLLASIGKTVTDQPPIEMSDTTDLKQVSDYIEFDINNTIKATTPNATVFIYVKAASGMPMPIAAEKHQLKTLPSQVTIDESDELTPLQKLSLQEEVIVGIKISAAASNDSETLYKQEKTTSLNKLKTITIHFNHK